MRVARNRHEHLVEFDSSAAVRALTPDFGAIAQIETRAIVVTARADDDNEEAADFVSRCFGPRVGIVRGEVSDDRVRLGGHAVTAGRGELVE